MTMIGKSCMATTVGTGRLVLDEKLFDALLAKGLHWLGIGFWVLLACVCIWILSVAYRNFRG